jgi:uncharacterized membrane protein (UPF0182 family)
MRENLASGLAAVFGEREPSKEPSLREEVAEEAIQNLIISALDHYQRAQDSLKAGDWAGYGRALDDMKRTLEELVARGGKTSPPEK